MPCVAHFSEAGRDRFYYFDPYPVCHATGEPFDLEQCVQRLGEGPFRRLEGLIAREPAPRSTGIAWLIVNAADAVIETRGYMEAGAVEPVPTGKAASPAGGWVGSGSVTSYRGLRPWPPTRRPGARASSRSRAAS